MAGSGIRPYGSRFLMVCHVKKKWESEQDSKQRDFITCFGHNQIQRQRWLWQLIGISHLFRPAKRPHAAGLLARCDQVARLCDVGDHQCL